MQMRIVGFQRAIRRVAADGGGARRFMGRGWSIAAGQVSFRAVASLLAICLLPLAEAVTPQPDEFNACRQWTDSIFRSDPSSVGPYLKLLYEDVADGIARDRSWRGTPFQLGDKTYTHGLAFNSTKHLLIHLGRPADRFTADVGIENNDDTQRGAAQGGGSVTFHVLVADKEVFKSPVRRLQDGPQHVDIPLQGAESFEIRVLDGGDGRGWDQALWGEASISLSDGGKLRLQDLPWFENVPTGPGFSFQYAGASGGPLLRGWTRAISERALDDQRARRSVTYRDPATGLEVELESVSFKDFPAVEWVVNFKNTSQTNSPMLESIQAFDSAIPLVSSATPVLHWAKGAVASFDDFEPLETVLKAGEKLHLQPGGGRSSSQVLPFFNFEGANAGVVAAIGWSGEWAADFACGARGQVTMKAGLARTHLVLHPGESIRTPRMVLLFYQGDRWRGQNLLRQFVLAHHRPQPSGKPLVAPITCGNWGGTRAEIHLDNIAQIIKHDLPLDYYWIDAEWFGKGGWPDNVGNWQVKKQLYPNGFKPLSDALRKTGRELMLWFEPERVYRGTPWYQEHHDWLLDTGGANCLLNLGNPEARTFLTDFIAAKIEEFGLGCYRQDFNIDPLPFWQAADAPDRQGITEIRYIEGLYAFWDGLLARHPDLIIDNCASGGRRLDLETLGRATPFWRTDGPRDAIAHQCHTYGLLGWIPLSATSQDRAGDDYEFRSSMCSSLCLNWWISGDAPAEKIPASFPFAWAKETLRKYVQFRSLYYGDYYPLTRYSQARDVWMAYQLDEPTIGRGLVVALRRPESPYQSARFPLRGLDEQGNYQVTDLDTGERRSLTGRALVREGLEVRMKTKPDSALVMYERTNPR